MQDRVSRALQIVTNALSFQSVDQLVAAINAGDQIAIKCLAICLAKGGCCAK